MPDSEPDDDSDLRARVRDLEATVSNQQEIIQKLMPSRRQTIAGLGLLGAGAGVGRLSTERARAQAAGQVGTDDDPVDVKAWDLNVAGQLTSDLDAGGNSVTNVGSMAVEDLDTETVGNQDYHYAGSYSGSDADARLDNALNAADSGDTIYLERDTYANNRDISTDLTLIGTAGRFAPSTDITGNWTFEATITLVGVGRLSDSELTINRDLCVVTRCSGGDNEIEVNDDGFRYVNNRGGNLTFASGTSAGIVDASTNVSVTDNGSNTVGDIA